MKKKGGLENVKLYYESLPSEPKAKRRTPKTNKKNNIENLLDSDLYIGLTVFLPFVFQHRLANRAGVLSRVDDRKTLPKVPQANKKRTTKPKR